MDAPRNVKTARQTAREELARTAARQRLRLEELLVAQRDRVGQIETELRGQLQEHNARLRRKSGDLQAWEERVQARQKALDQREAQLEARAAELAQADQRLAARAAAAAEDEQRFNARQAEVQADRRQAEAAWARVQAEREAFTTAQAALRQEQAALQVVRESLLQELSQFETRHAALRDQEAALTACEDEIRRQRQDLDAAEAELRRDRQQLAPQVHANQEESQRLDDLRQQLDARSAEIGAREESLQTETTRTEDQRRRIAQDLRAQRTALKRERERFTVERQKRAAAPAASSPAAPLAARLAAADETARDLKDRLKMAIDDLHTLKAKNAELEKQLAQAATAAAAADRPMNWEEQKRLLLAALESESEELSGHAPQNRLKIADVVKTTDDLLRQKDRELEEMKIILQDQSRQLQGLAVGASALGELLDGDALIREERENLRRLQQHWEDMVRQAEIDLSLERAKLTRERSDMAEKIRACETRLAQLQPGDTPQPKSDKPTGGWRAHWGLKSSE